MRPKKPRFCIVEVVMGAGVETGVVTGPGDESTVSAGVGVGDPSKRLSCARAPAAANRKVQKMMAGRIIDRLNTKAINRS